MIINVFNYETKEDKEAKKPCMQDAPASAKCTLLTKQQAPPEEVRENRMINQINGGEKSKYKKIYKNDFTH